MPLSFDKMLGILEGGKYLVPRGPEDIYKLIKETQLNIYFLDVSNEFLEKTDEEGLLTPRNGKSVKKIDVLYLWNTETFEILIENGMFVNKECADKLLYNLIRMKKDFVTADLLDLVYKHSSKKILEMVEEAKTKEVKTWIYKKQTGKTYKELFEIACKTENISYVRDFMEKDDVAISWLMQENDEGFLNIDSLIINSKDRLQAIYYLENLLKLPDIGMARRTWAKTASANNILKIVAVKQEVEELLVAA